MHVDCVCVYHVCVYHVCVRVFVFVCVCVCVCVWYNVYVCVCMCVYDTPTLFNSIILFIDILFYHLFP